MSPKAETLQKAFAHYCLEGKNPPEFLPTSKSSVYRRLVHGNFCENLKNAYPIAYQIFEQQEWQEMSEAFFSHPFHPSPYLWQMPSYFRGFVKNKNYAQRFQAPFLEDLLEFEWQEIAISMAENQRMPLGEGAFFAIPLQNPEHLVLSLNYPVFKTADRQKLSQKGKYFITLHRHPISKEVRFFEHSVFFLYLWERMKLNPLNMQKQLEISCEEMGVNRDASLVKLCKEWLRALEKEGLILGWR